LSYDPDNHCQYGDYDLSKKCNFPINRIQSLMQIINIVVIEHQRSGFLRGSGLCQQPAIAIKRADVGFIEMSNSWRSSPFREARI
jgi:hypothetical protein